MAAEGSAGSLTAGGNAEGPAASVAWLEVERSRSSGGSSWEAMLFVGVRELPIREKACKVAEEEPWVSEYGIESSCMVVISISFSGTLTRLETLPILTVG